MQARNTEMGRWSEEEDALLVQAVSQMGPRKWAKVAERIGTRIGKQCRERWHNHLNPAINNSAWTPEEDAAMLEMYVAHGPRWASMTSRLPGRTDNAIKNRFNACVRHMLGALARSPEPAKRPRSPPSTGRGCTKKRAPERRAKPVRFDLDAVCDTESLEVSATPSVLDSFSSVKRGGSSRKPFPKGKGGAVAQTESFLRASSVDPECVDKAFVGELCSFLGEECVSETRLPSADEDETSRTDAICVEAYPDIPASGLRVRVEKRVRKAECAKKFTLVTPGLLGASSMPLAALNARLARAA
jgi:hypothetical protein